MSTPYQAALYTPPRPVYPAEQPSLRQFLRCVADKSPVAVA